MPKFIYFILFFFNRTPSKQKSPKEDKDIDIVELLRNVDPKEYEKYARMYGITDYRGLLQAIEFLKREKEQESGRPVSLSQITVQQPQFLWVIRPSTLFLYQFMIHYLIISLTRVFPNKVRCKNFSWIMVILILMRILIV